MSITNELNEIYKKIVFNGEALKKVYFGDELVYSSGNIVTYVVDSGVSYQEEVDEGASCLSPQTFTPTKSGWTFAGWREDKTANGSVLTNKVMGDAPVTLYAVFKQDVTMNLYDNSTSPRPHYFDRLYNNANIVNPTYKIPQSAKSGWTARGWSTSNAANGAIAYAHNATITIDKNITLWGCYHKTVTMRYDGGGATGGSTATQSGIVYYNSSGQQLGATFSLSGCGYTLAERKFNGWRYGSQVLQPGAKVTIVDSTYATATWLQTVYRYNNAGNFAQVLTCPISANYRLEVWGAKGADRSGGGTGGYGGYAVGTQYLPAGTVLYIVVGGAGTITGGGYNGGGNGGSGNGGGGGATHIGLHNKLLRDYGNTSGLYIVAGGGGGGGSTHLNNNSSKGGSGGGANGEIGFNYDNHQAIDRGSGDGGTQTAAGRGGTFGQGGHADQFGGGGGGGGLYGGGFGTNYNGGAGGGGGSGYIGGVTNGSMAHWQNNGAGRAVITIL